MDTIQSNAEICSLYSGSYTMPRPLSLRQVEVFKGVIEHGTVSRAADVLAISQPAASKLLIGLESDSGLKLFERRKGRLMPTDQAMRLYEEVQRIFMGLRQVEDAVAAIRREDQERLAIGVIPALAGTFIQRAIMALLARHPGLHCSIHSMSSRSIASEIALRKLDLGIVSGRPDASGVLATPLLQHPLVCIMPRGHPLAERKRIEPEHLAGLPFISFDPNSHTGQKIATLFEQHRVEPNIVLTAYVNPTVCMFVAAGLGVSLVHPLFLAGLEEQVLVRPFSPAVPFDVQVCFARDGRNTRLVTAFTEVAGTAAASLLEELTQRWA